MISECSFSMESNNECIGGKRDRIGKFHQFDFVPLMSNIYHNYQSECFYLFDLILDFLKVELQNLNIQEEYEKLS